MDDKKTIEVKEAHYKEDFNNEVDHGVYTQAMKACIKGVRNGLKILKKLCELCNIDDISTPNIETIIYHNRKWKIKRNMFDENCLSSK